MWVDLAERQGHILIAGWTVGNAVRVFLLDDHEIVRRGVKELLETEGDLEVVGEAGTAAEALARIPPTRPDVAVLDVRLPDGDGVQVCREIRSAHPEIQCLMLTSFADDEALFQAIMAGASGYVLKQIKGADVVEAVRSVAAGRSLLDPSVTARVLERLRKGSEEDELLARLSPQERNILRLIADGLTNRQIAEQVHLAEKTVKNYVSNLLAKLGMERRTQAAVYAARLGAQATEGRSPDGRSALSRLSADPSAGAAAFTGRADGDDDLVGVDNGLGRRVRRERATAVPQCQDERPGAVPDVCLADAASLDR